MKSLGFWRELHRDAVGIRVMRRARGKILNMKEKRKKFHKKVVLEELFLTRNFFDAAAKVAQLFA